MKFSTAFLLGATALAGAASFSGTAQAIPFAAGSLAIGAGTSTTSTLGSTTLFTVVPPSVSLGTGTGDFAGLAATFAKTTFNLNDGTTFDFSDAGIGTFTANAGAVTILENLGGTTAVLAFFVAGSFTVGADFDNAGTVITADETFALTQTNGAGQAISISGTFQAPEVPPHVPEPMTLALLGGGLVGLGVMRRRAKA